MACTNLGPDRNLPLVYDHSEVRIFHSDCLHGFPDASVDLVLIDPPYLVGSHDR